MKYLKFAQLCWQAYNGNPQAAMQVIEILRGRFGI